MKKTFDIYEIIEKEVCIPNDNYYRSNNDWNDWREHTITVQEFVAGEFSTHEEAVIHIEQNLGKGKFTIIPTYTNL